MKQIALAAWPVWLCVLLAACGGSKPLTLSERNQQQLVGTWQATVLSAGGQTFTATEFGEVTFEFTQGGVMIHQLPGKPANTTRYRVEGNVIIDQANDELTLTILDIGSDRLKLRANLSPAEKYDITFEPRR